MTMTPEQQAALVKYIHVQLEVMFNYGIVVGAIVAFVTLEASYFLIDYIFEDEDELGRSRFINGFTWLKSWVRVNLSRRAKP